MLQALERFMVRRFNHKKKLQELAKHCAFKLSCAPSAQAVIAMWIVEQEIMKSIFPDDSAVTDTIEFLEKHYLRPKSELFGWFSSFCLQKGDNPRGPVSSRSNNPVESHWSVVKRELRHLSVMQRPSDRPELAAFATSMFAMFDFKDFKYEVDYLRDEKYKDLRYKAVRGSLMITQAAMQIGLSLPDLHSRFFFLHQESGLLFQMDELEMRSLVSELVEEKGRHRELSEQAFQDSVNGIDADKLFTLNALGWIIQFHPTHLPGSKESFLFASCSCPNFAKRALCQHVFSIHHLFFWKRYDVKDGSIDTDEAYSWPNENFLSQLGLSETRGQHYSFEPVGFGPSLPTNSDLWTGEDQLHVSFPTQIVTQSCADFPLENDPELKIYSQTSKETNLNFLTQANSACNTLRGIGIKQLQSWFPVWPKKHTMSSQGSAVKNSSKMTLAEKKALAKKEALECRLRVTKQICDRCGISRNNRDASLNFLPVSLL